MIRPPSSFKQGVLLLALVVSIFADVSAPRLHARQSTTSCGNLIGQVGASNGGRKVGIVIDASGSMVYNDPNDIRLAAGKALDATLISSSAATGGKSADLVTVVKFNVDAELLYPLGDPSGASSVIDSIGHDSGTFIGGGIKVATDELTKPGNDPTANRTGIVVLTDGLDDPSSLVTDTIAQITRAGSLGIRVSFGFLSTDASQQDPDILNAVFLTGGTFTTFDDAASQEAFIAQVLLQGLTGVDSKAGGGISLLPGLSTASLLSQTGGGTFTYGVKAGENINFTITAISDISLKATLRDTKTNTDINSTETDASGEGVLIYSATADIDLGLVVTATGENSSGIFEVGLLSSLQVCANTTVDNTTKPNNSTPPTVPLTGAGISGNVVSFSGFVFAVFGVFIAGLLL